MLKNRLKYIKMEKKGDIENFHPEKANVLYFNVVKEPNQMSSYGQLILNNDESKVNDGRENFEFIDTIKNSECFSKSQDIAKSHDFKNYENGPLNDEEIKQEKENNIAIKEKKIEYKSNLVQVNICQKLFFLQNMGRSCCVQKLF